MRTGDYTEGWGSPSSGRDTTTAITQQLQTTALGLHKSGRVNSQAVVEERPREQLFTIKLLSTDRFGDKDSHGLQLCTQ